METIPTHNESAAMRCPLGKNDCQYIDEIEALHQEINLLSQQVRTDALTGLYNFRFFNEAITQEMERTRRGTQPLSMILLDIDHFKKFNDQWGHEYGNHALVHVANLIKLAVRKLDYACRFGGEEFIILLPNTDLPQAVSVAERLREMLVSTELKLDNLSSVLITASFGVDLFSSSMSDTVEGFISRVDSWLYQAKHKGRNLVSHPNVLVMDKKESVTMEEKDALFNVFGDSTDN